MYDEQLKDEATLLRYAIKGEVNGHTFYGLLADKTTNPDAKRRLETLRDDEIRHEAILRGVFKKFVSEPLGELPDRGLDALATVFEKGKLKHLHSEVEYIGLAIEAERVTTKFYMAAKEAVKSDEFRTILQDLADEENGHFEILMAEKEALAGNYYWFSADGTQPMED